MIYQEFSPELLEHHIKVVATDLVIPGFVNRQDEDNRANMIALFNEKIGPIVRITVRPNGTA